MSGGDILWWVFIAFMFGIPEAAGGLWSEHVVRPLRKRHKRKLKERQQDRDLKARERLAAIERRQLDGKPFCQCTHARSFHASGLRCMFRTSDTSADGFNADGQCLCHEYVGPVPFNPYYAPELDLSPDPQMMGNTEL